MRKLIIPILLSSGLALSGCATVLPIVLGSVVQQGIGAAVGAATRGSGSATASPQLQNAAVTACVQQASQYGQASATTIQPVGNSNLRVVGAIAGSDSSPQRLFTCSFRNDGQITDFRLHQ